MTETELVRYTEPDAEIGARPESGMVAGFAAAAALDDDTFERNLTILKKGQERVRRIQEALMKEGVDYGTVGNTKRPTLMKPGAEKLTIAYGLVARITVDLRRGDGFGEPTLLYDATCYLHVGTWDGPIVAVGYGVASSWETKYRWRRGSPVCPDCGREGLKKTRRGVWWHPRDAMPSGGCDANFQLDDPRISSDTTRSENEDPWDNANTLMKMSEKRAHVDAILRATATSGLFTQDLEDQQPSAEGPVEVHRRDLLDPHDWTYEGFMAKAEVEFSKDHIAATAKSMFPDARSARSLDDASRQALFNRLLDEAQGGAVAESPYGS